MKVYLKRAFSVFSALALLCTSFVFCVPAAAAEDFEDYSMLGVLSAKYESNGNPASISDIAGDSGRTSYGAYQFSARSGIPLAFANWCVSSGRGEQTGNRLINAYSLDGNTYGENFNAEWLTIASEDSNAFLTLQHDYVKVNYYDIMLARLSKTVPQFNINHYTVALKNVIWSRAVQMGAYSKCIVNAFNNLGGFAYQSEDVLINAIYSECAALSDTGTNIITGTTAEKLGINGKYMKYFSTNSSSVQVGVYKRLTINELADALDMYAVYANDVTSYPVTRLSGGSRIETALAISSVCFSSTNTVVIANGYSFADALAGVPLAYALNAPILLTANGSGGIEKAVLNRITALGAKKAVILGGTVSVSDKISNQLKAAGCSVQRLSGANRYETAVAIAQYLVNLKGTSGGVFIASGLNYPDALSASPVAALKGAPIVYAGNGGELSSATERFIKNNKFSSATILGGEIAVAASAEQTLKNAGVSNISRVSGDNRYQTSLNIAKQYSSLFTCGDAALATGTNFPDALAGGVLAAKNGIPVVLISEKTVEQSLGTFLRSRGYNNIYVFGGTLSVSNQAVVKALY